MSSIESRWAAVVGRVERAAVRAGRDPDEITIVAVTKYAGVEAIRRVVDAGARHIGENRVHEALAKQADLPPGLRWHMIGTLQSNKVRMAIDRFDLFHSLDRVSLAEALARRAARAGREVQCLVQVNIAGEQQKHGLDPAEAGGFVETVSQLAPLRIQGLMTIAPQAKDPQEVRPVFRALRALRDEIERRSLPGVSMKTLSMGMTNDFEIAIEEGATMVRVGRAIFEPAS